MTSSFRLVLALAAFPTIASGCAFEVEEGGTAQQELSELGPTKSKAVYERVRFDESNKMTRQLLDSEGNPVEDDAEADAKLAECPVVLSFFDTCQWPKGWNRNVDTCVVHSAYSNSCQRWDGGWGGYTYLVNPCQGDVSNCNGFIVCAAGGC